MQDEKLFATAQYLMELYNYGRCTIPFEREELYYVVAETLLSLYIGYEVERGMTYIEITTSSLESDIKF